MRELAKMVAIRRTSVLVCVEKHLFWMFSRKLWELHTQLKAHIRTTTKNQNEIGSKDHMAGFFLLIILSASKLLSEQLQNSRGSIGGNSHVEVWITCRNGVFWRGLWSNVHIHGDILLMWWLIFVYIKTNHPFPDFFLMLLCCYDFHTLNETLLFFPIAPRFLIQHQLSPPSLPRLQIEFPCILFWLMGTFPLRCGKCARHMTKNPTASPWCKLGVPPSTPPPPRSRHRGKPFWTKTPSARGASGSRSLRPWRRRRRGATRGMRWAVCWTTCCSTKPSLGRSACGNSKSWARPRTCSLGARAEGLTLRASRSRFFGNRWRGRWAPWSGRSSRLRARRSREVSMHTTLGTLQGSRHWWRCTRSDTISFPTQFTQVGYLVATSTYNKTHFRGNKYNVNQQNVNFIDHCMVSLWSSNVCHIILHGANSWISMHHKIITVINSWTCIIR